MCCHRRGDKLDVVKGIESRARAFTSALPPDRKIPRALAFVRRPSFLACGASARSVRAPCTGPWAQSRGAGLRRLPPGLAASPTHPVQRPRGCPRGIVRAPAPRRLGWSPPQTHTPSQQRDFEPGIGVGVGPRARSEPQRPPSASGSGPASGSGRPPSASVAELDRPPRLKTKKTLCVPLSVRHCHHSNPRSSSFQT